MLGIPSLGPKKVKKLHDELGVDTIEALEAGLRAGAVGMVGVLFMAVANAAPITAMSFNVPVGAGWGNGIGVPGGRMGEYFAPWPARSGLGSP